MPRCSIICYLLLGYQGRHKKYCSISFFWLIFFEYVRLRFLVSFCLCFPAIFHYQCQVGELKVEAIRGAPFFSRTPWWEVGYSRFFIIDMDMKRLYRNVQACSTHTHSLVVIISATVLSARVGEGRAGDGWMGFWFLFNCGNLKTQLFVGSNRWAWHNLAT